jgi:hypothetical protein
MSIPNLVKRLVKGTALTAAEHDANLDAIEDAVDGKVESTTVTAIVALTNDAYEALNPKVATTLYIITNISPGTEDTTVYLGTVPIANTLAP